MLVVESIVLDVVLTYMSKIFHMCETGLISDDCKGRSILFTSFSLPNHSVSPSAWKYQHLIVSPLFYPGFSFDFCRLYLKVEFCTDLNPAGIHVFQTLPHWNHLLLMKLRPETEA